MSAGALGAVNRNREIGFGKPENEELDPTTELRGRQVVEESTRETLTNSIYVDRPLPCSL